MADVIVLICVMVAAAFTIWSVFAILGAFEKNPLVGKMLIKNIKAILSWRPKKKNPLKRKSFTEYPLVMVDGMVFEVLEATRQRGRIWRIKINMFNITEETRKIKLLETVYAWQGKEDFVLTSDTDYTVKAATGLVSTSQMILWSIKKPEEFIITYLNNGKPTSAFINLTQETNAVKKMKAQSIINKKEIEEIQKNNKEKAQHKGTDDEKNSVSNEVAVQEKNETEKTDDVASKDDKKIDEVEVLEEQNKGIENARQVDTDGEYEKSRRKNHPDKEEE